MRRYACSQIQLWTGPGTFGRYGDNAVSPVATDNEVAFVRVTTRSQPMGAGSARVRRCNGRTVARPVKVGTAFGVFYWMGILIGSCRNCHFYGFW